MRSGFILWTLYPQLITCINSASLQTEQLAVPDQYVVLYVRAPTEGIRRSSFNIC